MATNVIKKNMKKEKFSSKKIAKGIEEASRRAKLKGFKAKHIASKITRRVEKEFSKCAEIRTSEIRTCVLNELEKEDKKAAEEFRSYRKEVLFK
ncbi:MAG: ATP cone domain-containing protein [Candidatus Aenigmatarchaeota archaeon]